MWNLQLGMDVGVTSPKVELIVAAFVICCWIKGEWVGLGMDNVGSVLDEVGVLSTEALCDEGMLSCSDVVDVVVFVDGCDSIICWCS